MQTSTVSSTDRPEGSAPAGVTPAAAASEAAFDLSLAYAILRVTMGVGMLMRGLVRIVGGVDGFAAAVMPQFADTWLPAWSVRAFLLPLPFIEFAIGVCLLLGIFTRWALVVGALLIVALIFGTTLRQDWNLVWLQMFYALVYYVLLARRCDDAYTIRDVFARLRA